jgi:hypothetical protein
MESLGFKRMKLCGSREASVTRNTARHALRCIPFCASQTPAKPISPPFFRVSPTLLCPTHLCLRVSISISISISISSSLVSPPPPPFPDLSFSGNSPTSPSLSAHAKATTHLSTSKSLPSSSLSPTLTFQVSPKLIFNSSPTPPFPRPSAIPCSSRPLVPFFPLTRQSEKFCRVSAELHKVLHWQGSSS